jgi:deoxyribodipyrimidine photo-lyase
MPSPSGLRSTQASSTSVFWPRGRWYAGGISSPLSAATSCGTTGINTLRIYNPTKQALEQDPQGIFIKRWVPELAGVPALFIHTPWTMPAAVQQAAGCRIDHEYPAPIVDHAVAIRTAKQRLAAVRADPRARAEARDVAQRHGSRRDRRRAMQQDPVRRHLQREPPAARADQQQYFSFSDDENPHQNP